MKKLIHSLQTKLTLSFVILILVVSLLTFFFTFGETKKALREITRTELTAVASVIANELSGQDAETMVSLKIGQENTKEFSRLSKNIASIIRSHPDIKYVYTMKKSGDDLVFMVDPSFGDTEDPGAAIGEVYKDFTPEMLEGLNTPSSDRDFSSDKWGTFISGYAPLKDRKGRNIGMVGVDMSASVALKKQEFIGGTIYLIMAVGILLAAIFILLFSMTIIKDINKLNRIANDISMGKMDVGMDVKRKDEIGQLADSFGRMVASLKIMMTKE